MNSTSAIIVATLFFACCGCLQKNEQLPHDVQAALNKAQIIIATNLAGNSVVISNSELANIVHAMEGAAHDPHTSSQADPKWMLQFYTGTNLLFSTPFQDHLFYVAGKEFRGDKVVLRRLQERLDSHE